MIIDKNTKHFEATSYAPNKNWTEDTNLFVIEDGTPLAKKIIENSPYFDFVLDDEGNLIGITPTERPPNTPPEPTYEDYLLDLDFRLSMVELGL